MIKEVENLLEEYLSWVKDNTTLRQVDERWVEVTTPYLDRHNDFLQIYLKRDSSGFVLSDDGYVIDDLAMCGCQLNTSKRRDILKVILNGFGVQIGEENQLIVRASSENFALRKHNLIQAMLSVNDIFYLAEPIVTSLFLEDVTAWFDLKDIRYTPKVKFAGKSGYDYLFDFVIPKSRKKPERIVKTINHPNSDAAKNLMLAWVDTKEVRPLDSHAFAFLNDTEHSPSSSVLNALKNYDIQPVLWSKREEFQEELAA
jgi:hypothetical protein